MFRADMEKQAITTIQRTFVRVVLALALLLVAGCSGVPIAQDLTQAQANQIVDALNQEGVSARAYKDSGGRGRYRVEVKSDFYAASVSILESRGLPGKPKVTFDELISQRGFIPDSREIEALRVDHAIAVQIEEALENHPGIASSKVIVRSRSIDEDGKPAVSAVLQFKQKQKPTKEEVQQIVLKAVPGMQPKNFHLSLHEQGERSQGNGQGGAYREDDGVVRVPLVPFLSKWHVPEGEYNSLALTLVSLMIAIVLIGMLIGYWVGYFQSEKREIVGLENALPDFRPSSSLKLDGGKSSLPEV
jgi:type III secretory pathway lipoprotein EscJ